MVVLNRIKGLVGLVVAAIVPACNAKFTFSLPTSNHKPNTPIPADGMLIHGFCIMGATNFGATVSPDSGFYYKSVPDFGDGTEQAIDVHPKFRGVDGLGDQACEGGTYLQSSIHFGPPGGVDITVHADTEDGSPVTFCVMMEQDFLHTVNNHIYHRGGDWAPFLLEEGFTPSTPFTYWIYEDLWISYCKTFDPRTDPTYFGLDASKSLSSCPKDIKVKHTDGVTPFPGGSDAVSIVSQDTSTVTVDLKQSWAASVDKYFYSYRETSYSSKCYEEIGVAPGEVIDTITIQCNMMSPTAQLRICLQDTTDSFLTSGDDSTVPNCCHSDSPDGTATVCYQLEIQCETTC